MDLNTLVPLVERGDPDRFLAAMAAPPAARGPLLVLAAFNLELARAPWVTREPLIAQMRLQFWRDVVTGEGPAAHEVALPLQALIQDAGLPRDLLEAMIDARASEIGTVAPFADTAALGGYLRATAGSLMALSVIALGGPRSEAAQGLGAVQGLANYLLAVPALAAAGRRALPDESDAAIARLAGDGLDRLSALRADLRALPPVARPALRAAWRAQPLLAMARRDPGRVVSEGLAQSEFSRRGRLLWRVLSAGY